MFDIQLRAYWGASRDTQQEVYRERKCSKKFSGTTGNGCNKQL